ncbi:MAG: hypothetical protein WC829_04430 [Hyphomicrobium sp.]|jgi:hypothetical protein
MSDNIVKFVPKLSPSNDDTGGPRGEHVFTVELYERPDGVDSFIIQPNAPTPNIDMERFLKDIRKAFYSAHKINAEETGNPDHDLLLMSFMFRSGRTLNLWDEPREDRDNGFEAPRQLRWLRRRLDDVYWQIDERRGLAYHVYRFLNVIEIFIATLKGKRK